MNLNIGGVRKLWCLRESYDPLILLSINHSVNILQPLFHLVLEHET